MAPLGKIHYDGCLGHRMTQRLACRLSAERISLGLKLRSDESLTSWKWMAWSFSEDCLFIYIAPIITDLIGGCLVVDQCFQYGLATLRGQNIPFAASLRTMLPKQPRTMLLNM